MGEMTSDGGLPGVVRELLAELAGVDAGGLPPEASMGDLDLDSLDAGEFVVQLEAETGVRLDLREFGGDWSRLTVAELTAMIGRQHDGGARTPR